MSKDTVRSNQRSAVAHTKSPVSWVEGEIADCKFKDERLGKRFCSLLGQLSSRRGDSIPLACQDWANTKAAYQFLNNDRVNEAQILAGHFQSTPDRTVGINGPVLVMHDTTEFTYKREDIDAVGKTRICIAGGLRDGRPRYYTGCRILMHSSLAVTTGELPLGLTAIKFWSRQKFKGSDALKRGINPTRVPYRRKRKYTLAQ